jgi:hypothetical protein
VIFLAAARACHERNVNDAPGVGVDAQTSKVVVYGVAHHDSSGCEHAFYKTSRLGHRHDAQARPIAREHARQHRECLLVGQESVDAQKASLVDGGNAQRGELTVEEEELRHSLGGLLLAR